MQFTYTEPKKPVTLERICRAKVHVECWYKNKYSLESFIVNKIILPFHRIAELEDENTTMKQKHERQLKMYEKMREYGAFDYPEFQSMHPEKVVQIYIQLVSDAMKRKMQYIQKIDRIFNEFVM